MIPMSVTVKMVSILSGLFILFSFPTGTDNGSLFPEYCVVIDPGHGGINVEPHSQYGDRYDSISGKFLEVFKEGAVFKNVEEKTIMFDIGMRVIDLLTLTETDIGFERFRSIMKKYSSQKLSRVSIKAFISRPESRSREELESRDDPNDGFRLFDYPNADGDIEKGRISYINSLHPQLVVSLHCASITSRDHVGLNAVLCPPYSFMYKGLEILRHERTGNGFFTSSPWADWFEESGRRSLYKWFLSDASLYFTGFPLTRKNILDETSFKGYRYNMVSWMYADPPGWEEQARLHESGTRYATDLKKLVLDGPYWEREQSKFEAYRRDGGIEGYGGDNHYASAEILRYVISAANLAGYHHRDLRIAPPYTSVWSVPLYVNAISAYVELGYIKIPSHRKLLTEMQNSVAEGVAAGIYSLLTGMKADKIHGKYTPKGKSIDLAKYNTETTNYFSAVSKKE